MDEAAGAAEARLGGGETGVFATRAHGGRADGSDSNMRRTIGLEMDVLTQDKPRGEGESCVLVDWSDLSDARTCGAESRGRSLGDSAEDVVVRGGTIKSGSSGEIGYRRW